MHEVVIRDSKEAGVNKQGDTVSSDMMLHSEAI